MNILRWNRKSKKKFNFRTIVLLIFSLIMTTFAWFAYSKVLTPSLNIHMASWDMEYKINGEPKTNPISIDMPLYPTMSEEKVIVDIFNNGETLVDIDHEVKSLTIAGIEYEAIREGETPNIDRYITIAPTVKTTVERVVKTTDPDTNETTTTTVTEQVYKGVITNDITKFPFTIDIEYSTQVEPVSVTDYGVKVPGQGYLEVTVNWLGDNNDLDSEWGYLVGEYLANNPGASAMSLLLSIDSYQVDPKSPPVETVTTMPSTSTTRPYLPSGFTRVLGTTLQSGLVIQDANGNEFVWVEVPKSTAVYKKVGIELTEFTDDIVDENDNVIEKGTYTKIEEDLRNYVGDYSARPDEHSDWNAIGLSPSNYKALKHKMLKSIYNHGGFYIGRYETGLASGRRTGPTSSVTEGTAVIKPNVYPYNYVTSSQANTLASAMVPSSSGFTSSLLFGLQWDLVLKHLETKAVEQVPAAEKEAELAAIQTELKTDSSSWGNYHDNSYTLLNSDVKYMESPTATEWLSIMALDEDDDEKVIITPYDKDDDEKVLITSGGNSEMCKQNIYDLAGNLSEWTYDIIDTDDDFVFFGGNGGNYLSDGGPEYVPSDADGSEGEPSNLANVITANDYGSHLAATAYKEVGFRVALISDAVVDTPWGEIDTGSGSGSGGSGGDGSGDGSDDGEYKSPSELLESGALQIGDFVNYDAGTWTEDEIAAIQTGLASSPVAANNSTDLPSTDFQFGGFTAGASRNGNATLNDSEYNYVKNEDGEDITGWRVFDINDDGTVTLISAGNPEHYYHGDDAYTSEYILTGNANVEWNDADTSLYQKRDWNDYVNETQKAESATVLTKSALDAWYSKYIIEDANTYTKETLQMIYEEPYLKYQSVVDNYTSYWFGEAFDGYDLFLFSKVDRTIEGGGNDSWWLMNMSSVFRVLVTLDSSVLFSAESAGTTTLSGGNMDTYGGPQTYNIWNIQSGGSGDSGSSGGGSGTGSTLPSTEYTTPYMPSDDFEYVEGDLDSGIVIADAKGNEYVWVEVPRNATVYNDASDSAEDDLNDDGTVDDTTDDDILSYNPDSLTVAQYNAIETELKEYTKTYRNKTAYVDEFYSTAQHGFADAAAYNEQKYKMLKSVFKNGGFYIGRYETGIEAAPKTSGDASVEIPSETPVIKKNAYPYNYVTNKQAQKLASTKFDGGSHETSLLFGVQWDLILKYMETKAVEKGETQSTVITALNTNSTSWGNYYNNNWTIDNGSKYYTSSTGWKDGLYNGTGNKGNTSTPILLSTGASNTFSKQNIYDIAGNVNEWTLEYTSNTSYPCAYRGGSFNNSGSNNPASHRNNHTTTHYNYYYGIRLALY